MVSAKALDDAIRKVCTSYLTETEKLIEEGRKLYDLEENFLRDTLVEGNIIMGFGEPKAAAQRFRIALQRKRKRLQAEIDTTTTTISTANGKGKRKKNSNSETITATIDKLSEKDAIRIDQYRLASYSSIASPAEPILETLEERIANATNTQAHKTQGTKGSKHIKETSIHNKTESKQQIKEHKTPTQSKRERPPRRRQ